MSLAKPVASSSSSNGPRTTTLTTRGLCHGGSVVWAGPKFVRPHWWRSWVMIRFLDIQGPNCRETLHRPLPKATLVCKKNKKNRRRRRTCTRETKSFPFPLWKHYRTWCCWPVCDEFRLIWECTWHKKSTWQSLNFNPRAPDLKIDLTNFDFSIDSMWSFVK